jgi:hypothetical protein
MSPLPHQPPIYNVFSSFQWKMPLLPRPPVKADTDVTAQVRQMTSSTDHRQQNYTDTSASTNVPITDLHIILYLYLHLHLHLITTVTRFPTPIRVWVWSIWVALSP